MMRMSLWALCAMLPVAAQVTKPPEFDEPKTFRTGAPAGAIDTSSHIAGQREETNSNLTAALAKLTGGSVEERQAFERARGLIDRGMLAAAEAEFRAGATRHGDSLLLNVGLAVALFLKGRYDESMALLIAEAKTQDLRLLPFLGESIGAPEKHKQALEQCLREYVRVHARSAAAKYYLGVALSGDHPDEAVGLWTEAQRLDAADARPCLELARAATARENVPEAIAWLKQALARDPKLAAAHYRLARLYLATGEKQLADEHLEKFRALKSR